LKNILEEFDTKGENLPVLYVLVFLPYSDLTLQRMSPNLLFLIAWTVAVHNADVEAVMKKYISCTARLKLDPKPGVTKRAEPESQPGVRLYSLTKYGYNLLLRGQREVQT